MKDKPKISKKADGWRVILPAYGFGRPTQLGPFRTHRAALASLQASALGSAASSTERTKTPETRAWHEIWPVIFR